MKLTCQEHLLPGRDLLEKWDAAQKLGFQGLELRGHGDFAFRARLPELIAAHKAGVVMPSVCVIMNHFIGAFDATQRRDALDNMKSLLSVIAEVGGKGAVTPAAYGLHSNYLPPFKATRSTADDRKVLLEGLAELGDHAKKAGGTVWLEPLNRYEDHMLNTLAEGVSMCTELAHPAVKLMADLFHMNLEEANLPAALEAAGDWVGHVHVADSNRYEPGEGHTDFAAIFAALKRMKFSGFMAYECLLRHDAATSLAASMRHLTAAGATI